MLERELVLREGRSTCLAWSADGRWLASGGECGEVLVVDATHGAVRHELLTGSGGIARVEFTPDGRSLVALGEELVLWDLTTGEELERLRDRGPTALAMSRDGQWLAVATANDRVRIRRVADLSAEADLRIKGGTGIDALAFSPDGAQLAVGTRSGTTRVFSLATGTASHGHDEAGAVQSLAWLDDGRLLRLHQEPASLFGWADGQEPLSTGNLGFSVDPSGRLLVSWDAEKVQIQRTGGAPSELLGAGPCAVHSDGSTWARAMHGGVALYRGAEQSRTLPLRHRAKPMAVVVVGDGKHVAASAGVRPTVFRLGDGQAVVWPEPLLHGLPIQVPGVTELVVWTPGVPDRNGNAPGELTFWSLAAVAKGMVKPVRNVALPEMPLPGSGLAVPQFGADGRHFALRGAIFDSYEPKEGAWRVAFGAGAQVLPLPGGNSALVLEWINGLWWFHLQVAHSRAPEGGREPLQTYSVAKAAALDPTGARLCVLDKSGFQICQVEPWQVTAQVSGEWLGFAWLDARRVLALTSRGGVQIVPLDGSAPSATLQLPGEGWTFGSASGNRAVLWRQDGTIAVVQVDAR